MHEPVTFRKDIKNLLQHLSFFLGKVFGCILDLCSVIVLGVTENRVVSMDCMEGVKLLYISFCQLFHKFRIALDTFA